MRLEWLPVAAVLLIFVGLFAVITRPVAEVRASADTCGFNVTLTLTNNIEATRIRGTSTKSAYGLATELLLWPEVALFLKTDFLTPSPARGQFLLRVAWL